MRALLCRAASLCLLLAMPAEASAQSDPGVIRATPPSAPPRVIVIVPAPRAAVIERALLLIRGELAGVGLGAEVREQAPAGVAPVSDGVYGVLSLEAIGSTTVIRAYAPGDAKPIVANVDADEAGVDAEVIAVRAVETLRAAVLQFAQAHQEGLPDAVRGFAQLPKAPAPAPRAPPPRPRPPPPAPLQTPPLQVFFGPELTWQPRLLPSLGAQGGFILGPRWGFVALGFESTLYRSELSAPAGRAEISRRVLALQLGARFRLARNWEVTTRAGTGYASYAISGKPEPGYLGLAPSHGSLIVSAGVGAAYYFRRELGVYLNLAGGVALNAPIVRIAGDEASSLDRPSFAISSGALLGIF
jgi:hypothetical protein